MEQRLTQAQLQQIIAEVQALEQRAEDELSPARVREILEELNLPPEFLEEAMVQLRRREALKQEQRRKRLWLGGIAMVLALIVGGGFFWVQTRQQVLSRVVAQRDRVTLAADNGSSLNLVARNSGELFYRVTLTDAPVGQKLSLSCNWLNPSGEIVHQNQYQTRSITKPVWDTYCRYNPGVSAPPGTWRVQMLLNGRILEEASFTLR